ncbi:MAG: hypothetical protein BWK76_17915 [Desulfobulbaceae bacterium A2]|nr:MAG: hypothetical protein BWK76_17915 [Desulfobulbaceae bacterium A2]
MDIDKYFVGADQQVLVQDVLLETYYRNHDRSFLESEAGRLDMEANVNGRYLKSLQHIVPWVARQIELAGTTIVEIGCGPGSSTAAFAHFARKIYGYDIDGKSIDAARKRAEILGQDNAEFFLVTPENLLPAIVRAHAAEQVDIFLLFAVLEHMTIKERHEAISACWEMLRDGGLLVICETPNLLQYYDFHTSVLPFFHMLPSELCARYAVKSTRAGFNQDFSSHPMRPEEVELKMSRWGRGVSYHDFELAIGDDYAEHLVANGYEEEILTWFSDSVEEQVLRYYLWAKKINIPVGFARVALHLIFRKGAGLTGGAALPEPPPMVLGNVVELQQRLKTCEETLRISEAQLQQIVQSKRWKLGNLVAWPYRLLARKLAVRA